VSRDGGGRGDRERERKGSNCGMSENREAECRSSTSGFFKAPVSIKARAAGEIYDTVFVFYIFFKLIFFVEKELKGGWNFSLRPS
jgi:hypothetical protein